MKVPNEIFANAKDVNESAISVFSRAELLDSLLPWLDSWLVGSHYLDFEVFHYIGILIADAGFERIDADLLRWYRHDASAKRYEIMCDFLWGYWKSAKTADPETVSTLLGSLDQLPKTSGGYGMSLLALHSFVASRRIKSEEKEKVRANLLRHLEYLRETGLHEGTASFLEELR
jgi:hypothetical protein